MQKKTFNHLDLDVYEETLDNGLRIFVAPIDKHEIHASMTTLYGSEVLEFKPNGKDEYIEIPKGTAHFLEHKMFAKEDGLDPMTVFERNGASTNAYTSMHLTRYYFTGPSKCFENLKNLLDCVSKPYFTDENVEEEQGIIDQEIKAGLDDPEENLYNTLLYNTFHNMPNRYPVIGYVDSIKKLNPEILYDCYNTFYHPGNMTLTVTGNVIPEKIIEFVKDYYSDKDYEKLNKIEKKTYDEPRTVYKDNQIIIKDVNNKLVGTNYKIYIGDKKLGAFTAMLYLGIYLDIKFGVISKFNKNTFKDKNVLAPVSYYMDKMGDYIILAFDSEVIETNNFFEMIDKTINEREITEEDFNLIVKNLIKNLVLMTENIASVSNLIVNQYERYGEVIYDLYDRYKKLNYADCVEFIKNVDFSNRTTGVVQANKD